MPEERITAFRGNYRFLSNFYAVSITYEGDTYPSTEHAFQAAKTKDPKMRSAVRHAPTAGKAKSLGRGLKLRPDWDSVKLDVMLEVLRKKFAHRELGELLLATGEAELVEGNDWGDRFWGVDGEGENHLGRLLMQVRDELRQK